MAAVFATYNMSFASDKGLDPEGNGNFASEATHLLANKRAGGAPRAYWLNAFALVKKFWDETHNAAAMGLQEMNDGDDGQGGADFRAWIAGKPNLAFHIKQDQTGAKPWIAIVWNKDMLGNMTKSQLFPLSYPITEVGAAGQPGRPMLVIQTDKGYVLSSIHAPNSAPASEKTQSDLKAAIKNNIATFAPDADANKIFLMGDFNDRYDGMTTVEVNGVELKYQGRAPLSCCHNWDSSCKVERFDPTIGGRTGRDNVGTCTVPTYPAGSVFKTKDGDVDVTGKPYQLAGPGLRILMGEEGNVENYRYYGDKVFGASPAGNIRIYPEGEVGPSIRSDHQMVIAEFNIPQEGGYRKRRYGKKHTTRKMKKAKKAKKSRKH